MFWRVIDVFKHLSMNLTLICLVILLIVGAMEPVSNLENSIGKATPEAGVSGNGKWSLSGGRLKENSGIIAGIFRV
jgi:hypothetical protein